MGLFGMAGRAQKRKEKLKKRIDTQEKDERRDSEDNQGGRQGKKLGGKKNFRQTEEQEAVDELQKHQPGLKQFRDNKINPKKKEDHRSHEGPKKQQAPVHKQQHDKAGLGKPLVTAHVEPAGPVQVSKKQEIEQSQRSVDVKAAQSRKGKKKGFKEEGDALLEKYRAKLQGSTFRLLNEELYRSPNSFVAETLRDPTTYNDYHAGYRVQMEQWPVTPTELIVEALAKDKRGRFLQNREKHIPGSVKNQKWVIADMGCGDCAIAKSLVNTHGATIGRPVDQTEEVAPEKASSGTTPGTFTIHSFDLCAGSEYATAADMANVPLADNSADCVVFCLSLMATDYDRYIKEAHRILRSGKLLKVVEVRSRLPNPKQFAELVETMGFKCDWWDVAANYFVMFDFVKINEEQQAAQKEEESREFQRGNKYGGRKSNTGMAVQNMQLQEILAPCVYKRR